jgi:broad specificity phosphatase PhoE
MRKANYEYAHANNFMRNKYFLLRHGETIYQVKKRKMIYPWPEKKPIKLTKNGQKQIKKAAKILKKKKIDLIYSSDIFRTRQTAGIVAKELGKKTLFDKRLRDVNLGIYNGKTKEEFFKYFPRDSRERFYKRPKNGESWSDCQKRMLNFLKETDKKYKGKNILIISHGDPFMLLEEAVKKWSIPKLLKNMRTNFFKLGEIRKLN